MEIPNFASAETVRNEKNANKALLCRSQQGPRYRRGPRHRKTTSRTPIVAVFEPVEREKGEEQSLKREMTTNRELESVWPISTLRGRESGCSSLLLQLHTHPAPQWHVHARQDEVEHGAEQNRE